MVKQKINIHGITEKAGKSGNKYFMVDTSAGKMSCFPDYKGLEALRDAWKNNAEIEVNVETSEDGRFLNIRDEKFTKKTGTTSNGVEETYFEPKTEVINMAVNNTTPLKIPERKSVKGTAYEKDPVGLAVELFGPLVTATKGCNEEQVMTKAIQLVKQAQKAFS